MTFQVWKLKFLNSMTFQLSRDMCEPCKFEDKSKIKIRVYNIKCNLNQNGFSKKVNLTFLVWRGLEKLDVAKEGTQTGSPSSLSQQSVGIQLYC